MKAAQARKLKVGDWVLACFSGRGVNKACEITHISWPTFTLRTKDYRGQEMIRTRRYESLHGTYQPDGTPPSTPDWLSWPDSKDQDAKS